MILRLEQYLTRVAGGTEAIPENPETNTEAYLAILAGENRQAPEPVTRLDMYLYNLIGGNYPIPTPNTRIEQYLAKACGLEIEVPTPITREEQLWYAIANPNWQLTTLTGTLPLSFKSKGEALTDYKLYGTSEGAGVETESGEPTGYKLPMTVESGETENEFPFAEAGTFNFGNGTVISDGAGRFTVVTSTNSRVTDSALIPLAKQYTIPPSQGHDGEYTFYVGNSDVRAGLSVVLYDSNGNKIENWLCNSEWRIVPNYLGMIGSTIAYIGFSIVANKSVAETVITPMFSKNDGLTSYIPNRYSTTTPIYIGDTKLGAEEYVDYENGKVWKQRDNLFDAEQIVEDSISTASTYIEDGWLHYNTGPTPITINVDGQVGETFQFKLYIKNFSTVSSNNIRFILHYSDETSVITASNSYAAGISRYAQFASNPNKELVSVVSQNTSNRNAGIEISKSLIVKSDTMPETYLNPTNPPVPLPEISTYSGENTLSCSEELGEVSITGYIKEAGNG